MGKLVNLESKHIAAEALCRGVPSRDRLLGRSPLTPELKEFIDRAIVPALVEQYLDEIELAKEDDIDANSGQQHGRTKVRTVRP